MRYFISSRIDAIESALTFLHDNLHVDMPRVNDSILVLSPASVTEATQPIALAAIGSGNDDNEVGRTIVSASCLRSSQACGSSLSSWRSASCCSSRADPSATDRSARSPQ